VIYELTTITEDIKYAEGLRWHDGALWFSDMAAGRVVRMPRGDELEIVAEGIPLASGLGWTQAGELLVASIGENNVLLVDGSGMVQPLVPPGSHGGIGTNDMVTVGGRSYVSHAGKHYETGDEERHDFTDGGVLLFDHAARTGRPAITGMGQPNGMVITPDATTMFVADFPRREIAELGIEPDGSLTRRRVLATFDDGPDALTLDAELGIWAGFPGKSCYRRVDRDGTQTDEISVPDWATVACTLGGPDGRTLFLAMAQFASVAALLAGESKGRIQATTVAVPGAGSP
jgi:sugar lactone lactonase YvrE